LYSTLKTKVTRCWSPSHPNKYVSNARWNWQRWMDELMSLPLACQQMP